MSAAEQKPASGDAAASQVPASQELPPENTKAGIRARIWNHLEKNDLVNFPRPCHNRIPNFKGAEEAADKISSMDPFKKARTVKINPDKPQQQARCNVLEAGKRLLVPTPRLRVGLFNKIMPPENATKDQLRICATAQGVKEFSSPISLDDKVTVDLVVVGSVAVSKQGYRIGKGEGFFDLEWAMMNCMKAVNSDTIVITTVHDDQVREIPDELIQDHDVPVDFIVTPTQIIECPKRTKPTGVIWSKLTREKLRLVPILKKLREMERENSVDVTIWDEIEGNEAPPRERRGYQRRRRMNSRRSRNTDSEGDEQEGERGERDNRRGNRDNRRSDRDDRRSDRDDRRSDRDRDDRRSDRDRDDRRNDRDRDDRRNDRDRDDRRGDRDDRRDDRREKGGRPHRDRRNVRDDRDRDVEDGKESDVGPDKRRRNQRPRRPRKDSNRKRTGSSGEEKENDANSENRDNQDDRPRKPRRAPGNAPRSNRGPTFGVFVGGLPRALRVSEFKVSIRERDCNPVAVIWHGGSGHAFLLFPAAEEAEAALSKLNDIEVKGKVLRVEMANRRSRRPPTEEGDEKNVKEEIEIEP